MAAELELVCLEELLAEIEISNFFVDLHRIEQREGTKKDSNIPHDACSYSPGISSPHT